MYESHVIYYEKYHDKSNKNFKEYFDIVEMLLATVENTCGLIDKNDMVYG
jgi:hypothetical protein